jgi:branched-chain amino acid transport system substrate-binding protein
MRKLLVLVIIPLLLIVPLQSAAEVTLRIGAALALTGTAGPFGASELKGIQLAIDEINAKGGVDGRKLVLTAEDTLSTGTGTVNAVSKLINIDKFNVLIGPSWLDSFQGALPVAHKSKTLLITPSAGITNIKGAASVYPLVFSTYINFKREMERLIEEVTARKFQQVDLVFDQDPYCEGLRTFTKEILQKGNIAIGADHSFAPGEEDFRALLTKLRSSGSQAIIFVSIDQASVLSFLQQRRQPLPKSIIFSSHDMESYLNNPGFRGLLENIVYVVPAAAEPAFVEAFRSKFKEAPILTAANGYDALMLFIEAYRHSSRDPEAMAKYLRSRTFKSAAFGSIKFDEFGGVQGGDFEIRS